MGQKLGVEAIIRENSYANKVKKIFEEATREAALIGTSVSAVNTTVPFTFAQYPATTKRINTLLQNIASQTKVVITNGMKAEWLEANKANDAYVKRFLEGKTISKVKENKFYQRNMEALEAFQKRKDNGIDLSKRVWNATQQFKQEIEMGLDLGLGEGKPAAEIARELRKYLNEPDKLFRRVRDKHGNLQLSKNAKAYHPKAGVYRSSVKNAQRLARTEVNMAYKVSDYYRWNQMDFIIGIEIVLSNNHPVTDICDDLKGKYPKDFRFVGWHPQCRCLAVPILAKEEEFVKYNQGVAEGKRGSSFTGRVEDIPKQLKDWVEVNSGRINKTAILPYFLQDNLGLIGKQIK